MPETYQQVEKERDELRWKLDAALERVEELEAASAKTLVLIKLLEKKLK